MEFLFELILTLLFAFFFSLLIAKLVSVTSRETGDVSQVRAHSSEIESVDADVATEDLDEEIEHLRVRNETFESIGGEGDGIQSSGTTGEKTEENGVGGVGGGIKHLRAEDDIFESLRGDCDRIGSSGTIGEKTEEKEVDDVSAEKRCGEVKLEELDLNCNNFGGDRDSFEVSGTICEIIKSTEEDEVAVEGFDDVGGVKTEDEILKDIIRVDCDSFESSGTVCESIEKYVVDDVAVKQDEFTDVDEEYVVNRVSDEPAIEYSSVDGANVKDVGSVCVSFVSSGTDSDILEKNETEGANMMNLGDSHPVDDVAVEERSKVGKFVEQEWTKYHTFESSVAKNDIIESIGVEEDITVNSGRNSHDVGEKSDVREFDEFQHKIDENVRVNSVGSGNSGTNSESVENVSVGGDIELSSCNDVDEYGDWEGIERSELEESFAAAANYVFRGDKNVPEPKLDSSVKMELYGLNKVALEGPCREAQPLAIMVSARAKWNSWQRLGNMTPEVAMEQYISLLSEKAPEWMKGESSGDGSKYSSIVSEASPPDIGTHTETQLNPIEKRVPELNSATDEDDLAVGSISVNKI